ncbi:MAG: Ku protein [Myxococcales bacterium]|nr:Ku protein [Myxococcales bacterium]
MGTASITFGLVNIPVKLYSAANPRASLSFKLLSKEGHRLKQQYVDPQNSDQVVPRNEMVKGYEYSKDRFVLFTPEELSVLQEQATQQIEINEFVPKDAVPKAYYDKTFYLGPDKGGDRPYKLLLEAMEHTQRYGLARYAARGKMYLVLIASAGECLAMHQLHYANELVEPKEIPNGDAVIKEEELALATQIIQQISVDAFRPDMYEDEVKQRVEALIEKKIAGQDLTEVAPTETPASTSIVDLMAQLQESLEAAQDGDKKVS